MAMQTESSPARRVDYVELMLRASDEEEMFALAARCILQEFEAYYTESRRIPERAKEAFERRDAGESVRLSKKRLAFYGESVQGLADQLTRVFPLLASDEQLWRKVEAQYMPLVRGRYEEDLAIAYIHSARGLIFQDEWQPVDYSFGDWSKTGDGAPHMIHRFFRGGGALTAETVKEILQIPRFTAPWRDIDADAALVAERVNRDLGFDGSDPEAFRVVQMINAGFYRNRGAYLVGRMILKDYSLAPLVIALENEPEGIFVDAVLTLEGHCHNIFSSTLANFHVTNNFYHELSSFLHSIMPRRPLGVHYSTIGFNHVGKVAVFEELRGELARHKEVFQTAVGFRGTVAIGFSAPSSRYVLKVIRDEPTDQYKWGHFDGVDSVLKKYGMVHDINRTGSMLDNIVFRNINLDPAWFDPELLEELLEFAGSTVSRRRDGVVFRHLIVQAKMIPLPVFLETASETAARQVVVGLGDCIKNNAAANIFNKDLDGRNYGVSRFRKVYLFDYDALEPFTDVKIRTNADREDGEEDIPSWFFEEGFVFLPEEMEAGLRIEDRELRRLFREVHGDLLTVEYWEGMQKALAAGQIPRITIYPDSRKLRPPPGAEE